MRRVETRNVSEGKKYCVAMPTVDVFTCGELLIDFVATEVGATLAQASLFQKAPGGAPANVAFPGLTSVYASGKNIHMQCTYVTTF